MDPAARTAAPHICFVNSLRGLGGAELWFLETAQALRRRGLEASLVAQPGSRLLERARLAQVPCAAIPIRCDGAPWTLYRLWRHFRRTGVTALVCNLTKDLKAAGLAGRWAGVPIRLASRESDFPLKSKPYYRWYFGQAATGLLVNSEATGRTVLGSAPWLDPTRVHLLYKGIDTDRFQPCGPPPSRRPLTVGFVGQLIERKGLRTLMAAWRLLLNESWPDPGPVLRLAGEGPLQAEIERWRQGLPHPDRVELHGFTEDIAGFWAACGVPVVATRASSLPEVVHDGQTGLLVPVDQPAALAGALCRLLRDPDLSGTLGAAGRRLVITRFSQDRCLQRLLQLTCPEESS